jgi:hypothetical protein
MPYEEEEDTCMSYEEEEDTFAEEGERDLGPRFAHY